MRRVLVLLALLIALGGCSDDDGGDDPKASDVPEASQYDEYVSLAEEAGETPIPREDAATRAALNCDEDSGPDLYGEVPITEFPTDLALVKAYCPDRLDDLGG